MVPMAKPVIPVTTDHSLWQQIADLVDDIGLVGLDANGCIRSWNTGAEQLTGYREAEVRGRPLESVLKIDAQSVSFCVSQLATEAVGSILTREIRIARRDGLDVSLQIRAVRLSDETRQMEYGLVMRGDSSAGQLKATLHERELQLAEVEEIAGVGSYEIDPETWQGKCSDSLRRIYGFENDEPFRDFRTFCSRHVHPDDLERISRSRGQFLRTGGTEEFDYRFLHPDGHQRILNVRRRIVLDAKGKVSRFVGTVQDITERKRAEAELLASETRYRLALDTVQLGTWHLEIASSRLTLDARCQRHWNVHHQEMDIDPLMERIHPEDKELFRTMIQSVSSTEHPSGHFAIEHRVITAEGTIRWIAVRAVVRYSGAEADRRAVSAAGTTLDITKPRSAAVALRGQSRVFERIATAAPLHNVLDEITRFIESQIPDSLCSILLLDKDGERLRVAAASRLPAAYNAAIDGIRIGPDVGSCGTAAWSGKTVIASDTQLDPRWLNYRELADRHGLRSCWSVPIFAAAQASEFSSDRPLIGTFAVYRSVPGHPDRIAQLALASASHLAGVAVSSFRTLEEIRDSEARYSMISQITRSVTFAMTHRRSKWTVDWVRPQFGLLSGYSKEEIDQLGWKCLIHPEDVGRVEQLFARLAVGEIVREEIRYCTKAGRTLHVQMHARLLASDKEQGTATVIGGLLDISEFKAIEKSLRDSEERFHLAMLGANDGLWDWNLKTNEVFYSPRWMSMLGYAPGELPGHIDTWVALLHPEDALNARAQMQNFLRAYLDKYEVEFRLRHKDGSYRNIQSRGFLSRVNGEPVRVVGTNRDLTKRRIAELSLRRSEEFLRRAQVMAHLGSWSLDVRTSLLECSEECSRIYGLVGNACVLADWEKLIHPDDRSRVHEALLAALKGVPLEEEHRLIVRGKTKWVSVKASIETESDGSASHLMGVTQDVSARRRLEEQLRHSQKMEAFGQLAGGVAHDFNNLLTVINGFSEMLLSETEPDDPRFDCTRQIREAGERAAALTRQLLTVSRRQFTEPRVIDLNQIVTRSETMLRRLIGEDIRIEAMLQENLPSIKVDPGQIDQVFLNMAVNARDAMPAGGRLTISTHRIEIDSAGSSTEPHADLPPGRYVQLTISDTGTGMTEETKSRIYEPFFSTKGAGKGTGLGLATVYGIVQQNNGVISVESCPGEGTTFRIFFPACNAEPCSLDIPIRTGEAVQGTETILLAEDEPQVRQLAAMSLRSHGYQVFDSDSGEAALEIAQNHRGPLDLLITDVVMPGISGTELSSRLRQLHPNVRVLYMSGYTDDAVVRRGVFTSVDDFIQKPFTPMQLVLRVQDLLKAKAEVVELHQ